MSTQPTGSIQQIRTQLSEFVARESELAKTELTPAAKNAGIGVVWYAVLAAFAFHAIWMLIITLALVLGWLLSLAIGPWGGFTLGFLLAAVISALIAFVAFKLGAGRFRKVKAPTATIEEAKATLSAIADAVTGNQKADLSLASKDGETIETPRRSA